MAIILIKQPNISRLDTSLINESPRKDHPNLYNQWSLNMEVDYIKEYKFDSDCGGSNIYSTSYNFSNYIHKIYKNVVIGAVGGSSIINSGQNISIRATDLIQLDESFEVKTGAIFHADINPCNY